MPLLSALGVVVGGFIAGVILIGTDHVLIGVCVALASLPIGLAVWVKVSDRL